MTTQLSFQRPQRKERSMRHRRTCSLCLLAGQQQLSVIPVAAKPICYLASGVQLYVVVLQSVELAYHL